MVGRLYQGQRGKFECLADVDFFFFLNKRTEKQEREKGDSCTPKQNLKDLACVKLTGNHLGNQFLKTGITLSAHVKTHNM